MLTLPCALPVSRAAALCAQIFTPLVDKCKSLGRAMRIGTNHGSLSARILSYYGDTPRHVLVVCYQPASNGAATLNLKKQDCMQLCWHARD